MHDLNMQLVHVQLAVCPHEDGFTVSSSLI